MFYADQAGPSTRHPDNGENLPKLIAQSLDNGLSAGYICIMRLHSPQVVFCIIASQGTGAERLPVRKTHYQY